MTTEQESLSVEVKFGDTVQKSDLRVAQRYAALKLPGVDRRFFSTPEFAVSDAERRAYELEVMRSRGEI